MDYANIVDKLVARICAYFSENDLLGLGQVRATKLVYLMECEYYAWEQRRFTDLDWVFHHYGPWSPTLDRKLKEDFGAPEEQEMAGGTFRPVVWTPPEFDEPKLKLDVTAEGIMGRVLKRFAAMPYPELLDYVYFETVPMMSAERGQQLDFSGVMRREHFVDPASLLKKAEYEKLKKAFEALECESVELEKDVPSGESMAELLIMLNEGIELSLREGEIDLS